MKPNVPLGLFLIAASMFLAPFAFSRNQARAEKVLAVRRDPVPDPVVVRPIRRKLIKMTVTAYCPCELCCGKWAGGNKTSIGDDPRVCDGVAADPKLLKYRTRLRIPGVGIREVDDTGGAMRRDGRKGIYHIDVRMETHGKARQWGVRVLEVEILN